MAAVESDVDVDADVDADADTDADMDVVFKDPVSLLPNKKMKNHYIFQMCALFQKGFLALLKP